jgi:hypothetical protein
MTTRSLNAAAICIAFIAGLLVSNQIGVLQGQQKKAPGEGFAAVPGEKGGNDAFGPYDPVQNWPRPPGREPAESRGLDVFAGDRRVSRNSRTACS